MGLSLVPELRAFWDDEDVGICEGGGGAGAGGCLGGCGDYGDIEFSFGEVFGELVVFGLGGFYEDIRECSGVISEEAGEVGEGDGAADPDLHDGWWVPEGLAQVGEHAFEVFEMGADFFGEAEPGGGGLDPAGGAFEEDDAEEIFELADCAAYRALAQPDLASSTGETPGADDGAEGAQHGEADGVEVGCFRFMRHTHEST